VSEEQNHYVQTHEYVLQKARTKIDAILDWLQQINVGALNKFDILQNWVV
jgi:hypothetical protein